MNDQERGRLLESFARLLRLDGFFDDFYRRFLSSSPEAREKFKDTDMVAQADLLALQMIHLVAYFGDGEPSAEMKRLALLHSKAQLNIKPHLYNAWLEAFIATAARFDPLWSESLETEWRYALAPGIAYMKSHYAPPPPKKKGGL